MRVYTAPTSSVLYFLHGDHLSSVSVTTCGNSSGCGGVPNGGVLARQKYDAWGNMRGGLGAMPTDVGFTAQRSDATGLMYFKARYYAPSLGRFVSADTIVPEPGNPQALNRYAYVYNSPLQHTDPTGHQCSDCPPIPPLPWEQLAQAFEALVVSISSGIEGVAVGGAAVGLGVASGMMVYAGTPALLWAMEDGGPTYPMPAEYVPGAIQATYPLVGTTTVMVGVTAVFDKPAQKAVQSLADHLGFLLGESTGGFDPGNHDPRKPRNDRNSLEHIRNALKGIWNVIQKSNIRGGIEEFLTRHYSDLQRLGLLKAIEKLLENADRFRQDNPDYVQQIVEYLKKLGVQPPK